MKANCRLNGSYNKEGNYVWAAALTLAWKGLVKDIIKEPIRIQSDDQNSLNTTDNFNQSPCSSLMLSKDCYYAKAGYGNKTVHLINEEVSKKFPQKTTKKIEANLGDDEIISFAYFFKKLLFPISFNKKDVRFSGNEVKGFEAKDKGQKSQVLVHEYKSDSHFIIELKTKSIDDHVFIFKTDAKHSPEEVLEKFEGLKLTGSCVESADSFQMPKISFRHDRSVQQLLGKFLANPKFTSYFFGQIYEIINFDLDETGVKVENEGVIKLLRSGMPVQGRKFHLDSPFWIVMREKDNHPYFVAHITNLGQN